MLNYIMTRQSRGRDYADLLLMSPEHYAAYDAATIAIQRQQSNTSLGTLGFSALEYIGGGKRAEIVLDGGIGSNMPANTTFGLNTDSLRLRYNADRNFDKLFDGDGQMPIDKDAIAQFIGWMGELTMTNPLFNWRFYDSPFLRPNQPQVDRGRRAATATPVNSTPTKGRPSCPPTTTLMTCSSLPFKNVAVENPLKTMEAGRPIFDDVEHCVITAPGSPDIKVFPANSFARWVGNPFSGGQVKQSYAERFSHQYRQFKAHVAQTKSGTPLEHAPFLSDGTPRRIEGAERLHRRGAGRYRGQ